MEELIKSVTEKAGINPEQAKSAIGTVMEFIKAKLPGIGEQVQSALAGGGEGGGVAGAADALKKKFGF